jgi:hypothetical protein
VVLPILVILACFAVMFASLYLAKKGFGSWLIWGVLIGLGGVLLVFALMLPGGK